MARQRSTFGDIRTSPRNAKILRFLRRKPQPHAVVGETVDGDEHRAAVSQTGPTQWTDVLSVVRACIKITALDKEGNTLRVLSLDDDDAELRAESELEAATAIARNAGAGSVPIISVDIPRLVDNLARNMREVAGESARQQSLAFRDGFNAMTNVVNLCLGLLVRFEQRMAQIEDQRDEEREAAAGEPSATPGREQLVAMALQQALGNGGNGAAAMNPAMLQVLQQLQQQQRTEGGE